MPSLECTLTFTLIKLEKPEVDTSGQDSLFMGVKLAGSELFAPEVSEPDARQGIVMSAGPGRYSVNGVWIPNAVKAGDRVFFNEFAGYITNLDGLRAAGWDIPKEEIEDYRMIQEDSRGHTDIWAIINKDGSLTALADKVIVELIAGDDRTAGGIVLPETAIKHTRGKVIAVGPGRYELDEDTEEVTGKIEPIDLQVGDIVYVNNAGSRTKFNGKDMAIIPERFIGGKQVEEAEQPAT
jgi:chaperonin GroES